MVETLIPAGRTAKLDNLDGDLRVENRAVVQAKEGHHVMVSGKASFEGSVEVDCDFECGSLESSDGMVRINGDLVVHDDIDVEEALYTRGNLKAKKIDVGGRLVVGISLEAESTDVGGALEVQGNITADWVDVGGSFEVLGGVKLRDMDVGGTVEIGGGDVSGKIDVGGNFTSRKSLRFHRIDTGGTVELNGGEGKEIEVGGKLRSVGDLRCDEVEVGGLADVEGSLFVNEAEVGGRIRVSGDLGAVERLEVGGAAEVHGVLSGKDVDVGGTLRASKGVLSGSARIGGLVETAGGLKAAVIELGRGAKCIGPLVGGRIQIEERAHVQDVYCERLVVEKEARLGRLFVESVEIGDSCVVETLVYTKELREGTGVVHLSPPQKVENLPPFPL
jgi:predicted acyltransferase (DUF342 family)